MHSYKYLFILALVLQSCTDENILFYKTANINETNWEWKDAKAYNYIHTDTTRKVNFNAILRINDDYLYSNIWIKYRITGNKIKETGQFSIQLADDEYGKWLGQGSGSVLTYDQIFIQNKSLKPGKYKVIFWQNMRDPKN